MSKSSEYLPPFFSPLTHDEHAMLGRIALLWGQIDMMLDQLLNKSLGITSEQRMLLVGEKPIGAKLDLLKNSMHRIEDKRTRELSKQFWTLANETKTQRNRCFHGVWGFAVSNKKDILEPAASHYKDMQNPVKAKQLPALEKKLCKTARLGWDAVRIILDMETEATQACSRLWHGKGPNPAWLPEWIEHNPMDDALLGHKHKEGQLPYLEQRQ